VHNPIGEFNEAFVQANRERPGLEVLDELRVQCARSIAALRALDDKGWEKVGWSPEGSDRTIGSKRRVSSIAGYTSRTSATRSCNPRTITGPAKRSS